MQKAEGQQEKPPKRKSQKRSLKEGPGARDEEVTALKKQIAHLEAENKGLREQISAMANSMVRPVQSQTDPVREQRHNFFKYSNVRRY
jgi:hypothetical protein